MPDRDERGKKMDDTLMSRFDESESNETDEASETPEGPEAPKSSEASKMGDSGDTSGLSEESKASKTPLSEKANVLFYLSEGQADDLDLVEQTVALDVKRELGVELEKNRHIRPLVLHFGLERLQDLSPEEIHGLLTETDYVEDPPSE